MQTRSADDLVDLTEPTWGTVEAAADAAAVQPDAVRTWCRAGLVPTAEEPGGGELVCIDAVRVLAEAIDLNVRYWAEEAQEMRAELRRLRVRNEDLEQDNAVLRASIEGQTLAFSEGRLASSPAPLPTVDEVEVVGPEGDEVEEWAAVVPVAVRPAPGEHEDDYLPQPERGRRRRRR